MGAPAGIWTSRISLNDPTANGVCSVFGLLFTEEVRYLVTAKGGVLFDYRPYPTLITQHSV